MKQALLISISVYQKILSPVLKQLLGVSSMCRQTPSCSTFAKNAIIKQGAIKGSWSSLLRVLSCRPGVKYV